MSRRSLLLEELEKQLANFFNGLKDANLPDEISNVEKMEKNLKKKKEVLESRIRQKKANLWWPKLLLKCVMANSIFTIPYNTIYHPEDETGPWPRTASYVAAVTLLLLFGFAVFEAIIDEIADRKHRRNGDDLLESIDEKEETEMDKLINRYHKYFEDLMVNYILIHRRYKRVCNQYLLYFIVGNLIVWMNVFSSVIDTFFYNTKQDSQKTLNGILQVFILIISPVVNYRIIMNTIDEDNKVQF
ncbi:hypothetical protein B9Z55_027478 [Caenorhabditis nigoni]|uniref:Uncharacterized protein n=1 Tax=Caenorhabditis nigoni TaxID=1611254 RepID=A0A2G5SFP4_9PELO|nr:hypothetical protein B9Z55_027478 [Caenorhabditis nigoni]